MQPKRTIMMPVMLWLLTASAASHAATWYVATTGNDGNPGTAAQPFRTIQMGLSVAQSGDTVLVANGTYSGGL